MKMLNNDSKVSTCSKKTLMNAYTFKLGSTKPRRKHDPVSLYQRTSQSWKTNRFLKNRANLKEGRKLDLDGRNKLDKIL